MDCTRRGGWHIRVVETRILKMVESVIDRADSEEPADALLRQEFKKQREISRVDARTVSEAVFSYYRWRGWLDLEKPLRSRLTRALELKERYAAKPESFSNEELITRSVPEWIGTHLEVSREWVRSLQREPVLWLRVRHGKEELPLVLDCRPAGQGQLEEAFLYQGEEDLFRRPEFHAGEFEIQDISSQAVGWLCNAQPGETWWDACAGEGGKTLHLSDRMQNRGLIWATDRAVWRLKRLRLRAGRAKVFNYRAELWDGEAKRPTRTAFDGVLMDAPCSGVGTWGRNPHARWTLRPEDISELGELQGELLAHAAPGVKPGGRLVYSVCTLTRAETTDVVARFQEKFPEFNPVPMVNPFREEERAAQIWIWPQDCGGNGMFVAQWRRGGG
jgi:16S rRNA (cytosine967-C5)-methyltransferase